MKRLGRHDTLQLQAAQGWLEKERRVWEVRLDQLDAFVETLATKDNTHGPE